MVTFFFFSVVGQNAGPSARKTQGVCMFVQLNVAIFSAVPRAHSLQYSSAVKLIFKTI
jgi:hypothetical protein